MMDSLIHDMKLVLIICHQHPLGHPLQPDQREPVELVQRTRRNPIRSRIEAAQIAEQEAQGVADFPIHFGDLRKNRIRDPHVRLVVDGGHPQPQNIGTSLLHTWFGSTVLPIDLDILRPSPSSVKPWLRMPL